MTVTAKIKGTGLRGRDIVWWSEL